MLHRPRLTGSQLVPPAPSTAQKATRISSSAAIARRPQCTHITMNRLYGEHTCQNCGKVPSIGWLYSCVQDRFLPHKHVNSEVDALPTVSDSVDFFEAQSKVAESLGMGKSVVKQIREGEYTFDQIEIILKQRKTVIETIKKAENSSAQSTPSHSASTSKVPENVIASAGTTAAPAVQNAVTTSLPMSPAGTPSNTPNGSTTTTPTKIKKTKTRTCNFQVCHACRPYLQDRLYMSFAPVLKNEVPAVTENEMKKLPLLDSKIVSNLGLREPPKPAPPAIQTQNGSNVAMLQGDGYADESSEDWTPTSTTNSYSDSDFPSHTTGSFPCPGAGHCPVFDRTDGCAYDSGFDDGMRALNHGFTRENGFDQAAYQESYERLRRLRGSASTTPVETPSAGSSISLPEPTFEPLTPPTPMSGLGTSNEPGTANKAATDPGPVGIKESNSSLSGPVEVKGGLAVTEEGVESRMPDLRVGED